MTLLMLQEVPSDWTVVVSVATSVVSTVVALVATIIAARAYRQSKQDKEAEFEYKRPMFKLAHETIKRITIVNDDKSLTLLYRLFLTLQNSRVHSAKDVSVEGVIIEEDGAWSSGFSSSPVEERGEHDTVELDYDIPKDCNPEAVKILRLWLTYKDGITGRKYSQFLYRKIYLPASDISIVEAGLYELDRSEWKQHLKNEEIGYEERRTSVGKFLGLLDD